jgi:hypothetical protein
MLQRPAVMSQDDMEDTVPASSAVTQHDHYNGVAAAAGMAPAAAGASTAAAAAAAAAAPAPIAPLPLMEYSSSIWEVLLSSETKYAANPRYMEEVQTDLSYFMRAILADWLIEVAVEYELENQTLFLCVGYVDRFLSRYPVDRAKLQLLGVSCMLLASKYWEARPPSVEELIYISDRTYSREQVLAMEGVLLTSLDFALCQVTPWECAARLMAEMGRPEIDERTGHLSDVSHEYSSKCCSIVARCLKTICACTLTLCVRVRLAICVVCVTSVDDGIVHSRIVLPAVPSERDRSQRYLPRTLHKQPQPMGTFSSSTFGSCRSLSEANNELMFRFVGCALSVPFLVPFSPCPWSVRAVSAWNASKCACKRCTQPTCAWPPIRRD